MFRSTSIERVSEGVVRVDLRSPGYYDSTAQDRRLQPSVLHVVDG